VTKKRILVTGGAGFIGSNFCDYIDKVYPHYELVVVDALTYAASIDNLESAFKEGSREDRRFWYGNVCNAGLIDRLVAEVDWVVHFAAESHVTRSIYDDYDFFTTDVLGTQVVANAVLKNRKQGTRFIHVSTSEVYGTAETRLMDETHPLNPKSPYAAAKCGADRLVFSYIETYALPATIVRPFNNYGPRQHLEKVIPRFISGAILGETLKVHGGGVAERDFINVYDTCRAIDHILHASEHNALGKCFNVCSGESRSILEIAQQIQEIMQGRGFKVEIEEDLDRMGQVVRHTGDYSSIQEMMDWTPTISWDDGLNAVIDWYLEHRSVWEKTIWLRTVPVMTPGGDLEFH